MLKVCLILLLFPFLLKAQSYVPIRDLAKHEGELVTVRDSFYGGRIINDTTAIYSLGSLNPQQSLTVLHFLANGKSFGKEKRIIGRRNFNTVTVTGEVLIVNNAPVIIVRNEKFIHMEVPLYWHGNVP